jgi:ABC-2 type transport system ATP-binding protein
LYGRRIEGKRMTSALHAAGGHRPGRSAIAQVGGAAVVAAGLVKDFRHPWTMRTRRALDGLSLTIERGEIFGLLGPNGAGKTTALKLLLGLLRPTAGAAWLLGKPVRDRKSRLGVGYLPEQPYFLDRLSAHEFLVFSARLAGLQEADAGRRASAWLDRLGLSAAGRMRLRKYSKGMLQRVGLAHALLAQPDLVFLDEPMSGLDPAGRREFRDIILDCRRRGMTIVFSSHIMPDAEMLCDRVGVLSAGRLARVGALDELVADGGRAAEVVVRGQEPLLLPPRWTGVEQRVHGEHIELTLPDAALLHEVVQHLVEKGYQLVSAETKHRSLESVVLEYADASWKYGRFDPYATTPETQRRAG